MTRQLPNITNLNPWPKMEVSQVLAHQATMMEDCCRATITEASDATIMEGSQALIPPDTNLGRPQALTPTDTIMEALLSWTMEH